MELNDPGKALLLAVILAGSFGLVAMGRVPWEGVSYIVVAIVSFIVGNGDLAMRKRSSTAMIVPHLEPGQMATGTGPVRAAVIMPSAEQGDVLAGAAAAVVEAAQTAAQDVHQEPRYIPPGYLPMDPCRCGHRFERHGYVTEVGPIACRASVGAGLGPICGCPAFVPNLDPGV